MSSHPDPSRWHGGVVAIAAGLVLANAAAQPAANAARTEAAARGELLYATHCIECHNEQIHWRERKSASDWATLRAQVDRWQQAGHLAWSAEDVDAVTRYLNDTIYRFAAPQTQAQAATPAAPRRAAAAPAGAPVTAE